jgi:hypothetical protein
MKNLLAYGCLVAAALLSSCKHESKPSEQQRVTTLLTQGTGSWKPSSTAGVTVDGLDVTADMFKDFTITFGDGTLTTTGTTPVWLRQDTWHFKEGSTTVIIRGQDSKEVTIKDVSATELQLSLDWDQTTYADGGRLKSIPGTFVFTMSK